ncbi:MAG: GH92 family glycosyl hydrolase [Clostridium sp.]|nr:GH92 family glycosyl hydrolase [Clostridium sp.]
MNLYNQTIFMPKFTSWIASAALAAIPVFAVAGIHAQTSDELTSLVNPFVGTTNFGTTNPGAVVPNGMMSVVPFNVMGSDTNNFDKDARWWSTPYDKTNSFFTGFAHGALSGVGCPDMGALLTMATTGDLEPDYHLYGTPYSAEDAHPGYYTLRLDKYGITAEATATTRSSVERYTFPGGKGNILINLGQGLTNESGATVRRVSATEIEGSKLLGTFCYNPQKVFPVYFVLRVSRRPDASGYWKMQPELTGVEAEWTPDDGTYKIYTEYGRDLSGDDIGYWFSYSDLEPGETVEVRMGISYVSTANARENLDKEQMTLTFEDVRSAANDRWNADLGRIRVEGGTDEQRRVFYTALYHALIHPNILNDINGEYPRMENFENGVVEDGHNRYTVFSLWDTYRNLHQLMTLAYPERQTDMVRSMIGMYDDWGWLPKWELYGRETFTMEGDPSIPVIVDTWRKGLRDYDIDKAYEAMVKSATTPGAANPMRPDNDPYLHLGYIPLGFYAGDNSGDNSVSHALEYYVADAALAWLAAERGDTELARTLDARSKGYRNYYSRESGTLRPLNSDGTFLSPFNPRQGENFEEVPGFHEGSAWNYTFFVPHDVDGLIKLMGGKKKFVDKLQMVFDEGLYDPANEPDIAYPYLFSRVKGEEWRTQQQVNRLLNKWFTTKPDGIPGNDDTGTMSAWAVFSMLGLYPDAPGEPFYTLTSPVFDRATITPGDGRTIVIEAERPAGLSPDSPAYIESMSLGGKTLKDYRIGHDRLIDGATLKFNLKETHK